MLRLAGYSLIQGAVWDCYKVKLDLFRLWEFAQPHMGSNFTPLEKFHYRLCSWKENKNTDAIQIVWNILYIHGMNVLIHISCALKKKIEKTVTPYKSYEIFCMFIEWMFLCKTLTIPFIVPVDDTIFPSSSVYFKSRI